MRNPAHAVILLVGLTLTSSAGARELAPYFAGGKSYAVPGQLELRAGKDVLVLAKGTNAEIRVALEKKPEPDLAARRDLGIETCIVVAKDCFEDCTGRIARFYGFIPPHLAVKRFDRDSLKPFAACPK